MHWKELVSESEDPYSVLIIVNIIDCHPCGLCNRNIGTEGGALQGTENTFDSLRAYWNIEFTFDKPSGILEYQIYR